MPESRGRLVGTLSGFLFIDKLKRLGEHLPCATQLVYMFLGGCGEYGPWSNNDGSIIWGSYAMVCLPVIEPDPGPGGE